MVAARAARTTPSTSTSTSTARARQKSSTSTSMLTLQITAQADEMQVMTTRTRTHLTTPVRMPTSSIFRSRSTHQVRIMSYTTSRKGFQLFWRGGTIS
eukprot:3200026-Pyramimonas_sp.AAC.1